MIFLFFQEEDGIRDRNVTGVQTCALPISCSEVGQTSTRARANGQCRGRQSQAAPAVVRRRSTASAGLQWQWPEGEEARAQLARPADSVPSDFACGRLGTGSRSQQTSMELRIR